MRMLLRCPNKRSAPEGRAALTSLVPDAKPLRAGVTLGGNKIGRCLGSCPSAAVEKHDLGQIAPFHVAPVGPSYGSRPAGYLATTQVLGEVRGLAAAHPLDAEQADNFAANAQSAGIDDLGHSDYRFSSESCAVVVGSSLFSSREIEGSTGIGDPCTLVTRIMAGRIGGAKKKSHANQHHCRSRCQSAKRTDARPLCTGHGGVDTYWVFVRRLHTCSIGPFRGD